MITVMTQAERDRLAELLEKPLINSTGLEIEESIVLLEKRRMELQADIELLEEYQADLDQADESPFTPHRVAWNYVMATAAAENDEDYHRRMAQVDEMAMGMSVTDAHGVVAHLAEFVVNLIREACAGDVDDALKVILDAERIIPSEVEL